MPPEPARGDDAPAGASAYLLRLALDNVGDGVTLLAPDGSVLFRNAAASQSRGSLAETRIHCAGGGTVLVQRDETLLRARDAELADLRQAAARETGLRRAMLDNLPDGVTLYEANGDITEINAACYRLNRLPPEVFAGIRNVRDAVRWQIENDQLPRTHDDIEDQLDAHVTLFLSATPQPLRAGTLRALAGSELAAPARWPPPWPAP